MSDNDVVTTTISPTPSGGECEELKRQEEKESRDEVRSKEKSDVMARYINTGMLGAAFIAMGANLTIFGLTLPSIAGNMNETVESLSPTLVIRGAGYLVGSAICGGLEGKMDIYAILIFSLLLTSVGQLFTPLLLNKAALFLVLAVTSVGLGGLETVGNVLCLQIWGDRVEPHLQFLHFCFCLGCAVTPLFARPFLNENRNHLDHLSSYVTASRPENATDDDFSLRAIENTGIPYVSIVYFMIVALTTGVAVVFVALKLLSKTGGTTSRQKNTIPKEGRRFRFGMMALIFIFYLIYSGMEVTFLTLLFTFCGSDLKGMGYNKDDASNLNALFYLCVTLGQLFAVFLSKKLSPTAILAGDLLVLVASTLLMTCLPLYAPSAHRVFWVGLIFCGLSGASIYGTMFLWAERYITVNGRAASVFIVGASLGEMLLPLPVGSLIDDQPMFFLIFGLIYASSIGLLFLFMIRVASWKGKRLKRETGSTSESLKLKLDNSRDECTSKA